MKRARKAFTLIELAIVIAAVAILAAVVAHFAKNYSVSAKAEQLAWTAKKVEDALMQFYQDTGYIPRGLEPLMTNHRWGGGFNSGASIPGWKGPYLQVKRHFWNDPADIILPGGLYIVGGGGWCGLSSNSWTLVFWGYDSAFGRRLAQEIDRMIDDGNLNAGNCRFYTNWCGNSGRNSLRCTILVNGQLQYWNWI